MTQMCMVVTQMDMCPIEVNQNEKLLLVLMPHTPTSAYMYYEVEMSSLHLDLAECSFDTHTHSLAHSLTHNKMHTNSNHARHASNCRATHL